MQKEKIEIGIDIIKMLDGLKSTSTETYEEVILGLIVLKEIDGGTKK